LLLQQRLVKQARNYWLFLAEEHLSRQWLGAVISVA
jgi:hypothetical protein